jgi:hypothetical protein
MYLIQYHYENSQCGANSYAKIVADLPWVYEYIEETINDTTHLWDELQILMDLLKDASGHDYLWSTEDAWIEGFEVTYSDKYCRLQDTMESCDNYTFQRSTVEVWLELCI